MEIFFVVMIILVTIGMSNIVNHVLPFIPVPLIQITLGILIALISDIDIPMEPELFFVLFIAPILFHDGREVSKSALWELRKQILLMALGLVFLTVLVIGYLTHWLIPTIPLSAAFALAAILSPTDIVAVSAMSSRVKIPNRILHLLEGEGLMNDASGLVAFHFAIAATLTGAFSLSEACFSFLKISIGGFMGGAILAYLIIRFKSFVRRNGMEDVNFHMLVQILTPFVIYLVVEHFGLSGILAVVAGGIVYAVEQKNEKSSTIKLQIVSKSTWIVLLYVLNGFVFVLLGLQVPKILKEIFKDPSFDNGVVIGYTIIITIALFVIRFIWLFLVEQWRGKSKRQRENKTSVRDIIIGTISGVRGSVTLAGAFSIPFVLDDGTIFPERSLIIFIAAGVILISIITASVLLPIVAKSETKECKNNEEEFEKKALILCHEAAIHAVRESMDEENQEAALSVITNYNRTLKQMKLEKEGMNRWDIKKIEMDIRMKALKEELYYVTEMLENQKIDKEEALLFQTNIRRMEIAVTNHFKFKILMIFVLLKRIIYHTSLLLLPKNHKIRVEHRERTMKIIHVRKELSEKAIQAVKNGITKENKEVSDLIIDEYLTLMANNPKKREEHKDNFACYERELKEKAFQAERNEIQRLYEGGCLTKELTLKIRKQINIREAYFMEIKDF